MPDLRSHLTEARHRSEDLVQALAEADAVTMSPRGRALVHEVRRAAEDFDKRLWIAVNEAFQAEGEFARSGHAD